MPAGLDAAKETLAAAISDAYKKARDEGTKGAADPDQIITDLATDLSAAVHTYTLEAKVQTNDTISTGQMDAPCSGMTVSPGTGTGEGFLE